MADISPFTIAVPQSSLDDLHQRLKLAKSPTELDDAGWDLGTPVSVTQKIVDYWRDKFDWRAAERKLNELPHFGTEITVDGFEPLQIHFLYKESPVPNAIPLLYVHGWPGSFLEGSKILNTLSGDGINDPAFHVVVMSLPNYGFSEGSKKRGFALEQYAETCHKLMLKLGYEQYVTQGGDWDYYITRTVSLLYPEHCKATHINFDYGGGPPSWSQYPLLALEHSLKPYTEREKAGLERRKWFTEESSGYRAIQATKPTTVGYAFVDSPVAFMSWMFEKLHDWSDNYPWTEDEICTWVSIYCFSTAGPEASLRIYYESTHTWSNSRPDKVTRARTGEWIPHVKIGYSHQPMELRNVPSTWVRKLGNIVFDRDNESGGHFFAYETPQCLIRDVHDMFRKGGGAYGILDKATGYLA